MKKIHYQDELFQVDDDGKIIKETLMYSTTNVELTNSTASAAFIGVVLTFICIPLKIKLEQYGTLYAIFIMLAMTSPFIRYSVKTKYDPDHNNKITQRLEKLGFKKYFIINEDFPPDDDYYEGYIFVTNGSCCWKKDNIVVNNDTESIKSYFKNKSSNQK